MPSPQTRRRVLQSLAAVTTTSSVGCLGGNDHDADETDEDYLVLSNHGPRERVVSVLVGQDGDQIAGGRYRIPKDTEIHLERSFEWGTYSIQGKLHRDEEAYEQWQSWTWEPRSCATGEYTNDDGYWTGTLRVSDPLLGFSHTECPTEFGGPGGGGGGNRPVEATEYRLGDVTDAPTTTTSE